MKWLAELSFPIPDPRLQNWKTTSEGRNLKMAEQDEQQIFPSKKKKKQHHGHHGGAWKVAYADFVTAMMALFIVLWILGQSEQVKQAVAGYFQDPAGFKISGMNSGTSKGIIKLGVDASQKKQAQQIQREIEKKQFEEMKGKIMKELNQNPAFSDLKNQIEITTTKEGLKIEMVESTNNVFFKIGSATLNQEAKAILEQIGGDLKSLPNKIVIEGHTDSRRYIGDIKNYDNFNLSADRANAAKLALLSGGMTEIQVDEIRGYADKRLRNKDDPFNLVNRRISIILKYLQK